MAKGTVSYIRKTDNLWGRIKDASDQTKVYKFFSSDVKEPCFSHLKKNDNVTYKLRKDVFSDKDFATDIVKTV